MSFCEKVRYVWLDGALVSCEKAVVHVQAHGLHYGYGVFEGIRAYWSESNLYVFRLRDHMVRFLNSAKIIGLNLSFSLRELEEAVLETIRANEFKEDIYVRPIAFTSEPRIGLSPLGVKVSVAITITPFGKYHKPEGIRVKTSSWRRVPGFSIPVMAKATGIYLNSIIALLEAKREGYDDAILLDWRGNVSEATGANVMIVRRGKIVTPPLSASILEGITRDTVIEIARGLGVETLERNIPREELYVADEIFLVGTAAEVTPVLEVDGKPVGDGKPGPVTSMIREAYLKVVRGLDERYAKWLTPVY
ncbi:MAG: branched-chain amino acid transaminase [Acidilobaceae archaeon]